MDRMFSRLPRSIVYIRLGIINMDRSVTEYLKQYFSEVGYKH
jgi:hypothetical protein